MRHLVQLHPGARELRDRRGLGSTPAQLATHAPGEVRLQNSQNLQKICKFLAGSFSAVSRPNFATKYAFESSRRDLHNALLCTALYSHFFVKICQFFFAKICEIQIQILSNSAKIWPKNAKISVMFEQKSELPERCKGLHCVDLGESFPTSIYLQNLASIQPRSSPLKFARSLAVQ